MLKKTLVIAVGSLLLGVTFSASAHGGGGGGGGNFGSAAPSHASKEAMANSNGSFSGDRDKGQQRAEDRRSLEGSSHEKAQDNRKHHNTKHAQKH